MFVIADIEWAINNKKRECLTQIAAHVVDHQWNIIDSYSSFIRPYDASFEDWSQVCYNGGRSKYFKYAPTAITVVKEFEKWMNKDDILLFWHHSSSNLYEKMYKIFFKKDYERKCIPIVNYLATFFQKDTTNKMNPYYLAANEGISIPSLEHFSENDVDVVRSLLCKIQVNQNIFLSPQPQTDYKPDTNTCPFVYDKNTKLAHKQGCPHISRDNELKGYIKIESCLKRKYKGCCDCGMFDELKKAKKAQNIDILSRSEYNYVYTSTSKVFHKPSCRYIINTGETILGAINYSTAIKKGRNPCKVCMPTDKDFKKQANNQPVIDPTKSSINKKYVSNDEKRAIGRYNRAKRERTEGLSAIGLTKEEKNDIYTLTQTEYAFWSAKGYSTFHIRACPKLSRMNNYIGFKQYDHAIKAGYTPCKTCRPTSKHNVKLSIPIANEHRSNDSMANLIYLCEKAGYKYKDENLCFTVFTPVGEWRIHTHTTPIKVEHKHIENYSEFHMQPRVFLSLFDTFQYIQRHDNCIISRKNGINKK